MDSDQTIHKYCGDIRERLLVCRTRHIALELKKRLCSELRLNCESNMVNNVLNAHVDELINEIFDLDGKNKYLEAQNEAH